MVFKLQGLVRIKLNKKKTCFSSLFLQPFLYDAFTVIGGNYLQAINMQIGEQKQKRKKKQEEKMLVTFPLFSVTAT